MAQVISRHPESEKIHSGAAARAVDAVKVYGSGDTSVRALDSVSIDIGAGRFTAIMGPSGSGKSTLLHCLAGLDRLTSGEIFLGEIEVSSLTESQLTKLRRDSIGFVFQFFNLVPTLNAGENISLPLALAGKKADPGWLETVVGALHMGDRLHHLPGELSGGQQQRIAAARALVSQPAIIFADEPTGNLDSRAGGELLGFMREAVDQFGQTIVMVTHDATAASFADRVVFLADGQIVQEMYQPRADKILELMKSLTA